VGLPRVVPWGLGACVLGVYHDEFLHGPLALESPRVTMSKYHDQVSQSFLQEGAHC